MTKKPNCLTCNKFSYIERDVNSGKLCQACGCPQDQVLKIPACDGEVSQYNQIITKEHGCLDHPQAREYLNADVIKELERRMINLDNNGCWNSLEGYKEAIALIKEGVKK
jgi:hypothetical protein